MRCPHCSTVTLEPTTLESNLSVQACITCRGVWISSASYWAWLKQHEPGLPEKPAADAPLPEADDDRAWLCPACGRILLRYRIGHGLTFALDRCGQCGGVWLDAQEWEALVARNLHDDLHTFFTAQWQRQIRLEEHRKALEAIYRRLFGAEDYAEVRRVWAWLDGHPLRSALLAYLSAEDPYAP